MSSKLCMEAIALTLLNNCFPEERIQSISCDALLYLSSSMHDAVSTITHEEARKQGNRRVEIPQAE